MTRTWRHVVDEAARDEILKKGSVDRWLRGLAPDSRIGEANVLHRFLLFRRRKGLQSDPDALIEEMKNGTNETRIQHLQTLLDWVEGERDGEFSYCKPRTIRGYYRSVRGFYAHNLLELPRHAPNLPDENGDGEVEVSTEPTADEFLKLVRRVLDSGKLSVRDRSIVLTKVQGLFDNKVLCQVFNYVAFPQLAKHFGTEDFRLWDEAKVPVRLDVVRTKTGYQHYTFLDRDAIAALKEWLAVREAMLGKIKVYPARDPKNHPRSDPVYVTKNEGEARPLRNTYVSTLFNRFGRRAGVNLPAPRDGLPPEKGGTRHYPFHAHEVRDTGITIARSLGVDREVVEFFAGHNIDRMGYDKSPKNDPAHFREQYAKLAPHLNVVSGRVELARREARREAERQMVQQSQRTERELEDVRGQVRRILELLAAGGKADPAALLQLVAAEK